MGQRQSGHKHDRKHTGYDKEQPSVISAAVSHCLCQYQTAVCYFCFFRFVKIERLGGNVVCCRKFAMKRRQRGVGVGQQETALSKFTNRARSLLRRRTSAETSCEATQPTGRGLSSMGTARRVGQREGAERKTVRKTRHEMSSQLADVNWSH